MIDGPKILGDELVAGKSSKIQAIPRRLVSFESHEEGRISTGGGIRSRIAEETRLARKPCHARRRAAFPVCRATKASEAKGQTRETRRTRRARATIEVQPAFSRDARAMGSG
jgi:hypothetical protein